LQSELDSLRAANDALRAELAGRDALLAQYRQPGAVTIAIGDATGEHPNAIGTLTLQPDSGAATLSVANLPPLDETQTYQAWLIVEGAPVSAGTFNVDQSGAARHAISGAAPGSFEAVGVSIEPAGGSEQPTPDQIILLSGFPF
jgi:anti-sigma-K factor RskA